MENRVKELLSNRGKTSGTFDEQLGTSCRQFFAQRVEFRAARQPDSYLAHLKANYKPLNILEPEDDKMEPMDTSDSPTTSSSIGSTIHGGAIGDGFPHPKRVLFSPDKLEVAWKQVRAIGAGLSNMGNTCFLNSVLQCLSHTPPLFNYVMSDHHKQTCKWRQGNTQGFCSMCELHRHCTRAMAGNGIIKPFPIVQNLKAIAKHFRVGRQEDAHEFLRYFVDGLQKSCLQGHHQNLDPHSKATTVVHQIFGGYHRSQVKCLGCLKTSETYDPLLDVSLDIKNAPSLLKALHKSVKPDLLDGENKYACPFCRKMTKAQKKLTIHQLPKVLTIQLKRFDYNGMFGGKIVKPITYPEHLNMRPFMSDSQGTHSWYSLYSVLVHYGFSCHSGHYYCYVKSSNGTWYCMNDSQVTQVSKHTALNQEAYLLFYIKNDSYQPPARGEGQTDAGKSPALNIKPDPNFLGAPVKRQAGVDKTGIPLVRHIRKPTGVVTPSRQTTPTREFSIPLRKADTTGLMKYRRTSPTEISPPKPTTVPPPSFVPRIIVAPKKLKVTPESSRKVHPTAVVEEMEEDEEGEEKGESVETMELNDKPGTTAPPSSPEGEMGGEQDMTRDEDQEERLLDISEMKIDEKKPSSLDSDVHPGAPVVSEGDFIGPVLPPHLQTHSPSFLPLLKPLPTTTTTKVARVHPQPQHQLNKKPVARVLPSLHVQFPKPVTSAVIENESGEALKAAAKPEKEEEVEGHTKEEEAKGHLKDHKVKGHSKKAESPAKGAEGKEDEISSQMSEKATRKKEGKDSELAKADSTTHPDQEHHHLISQSQWTVSDPRPTQPFGPALPEDYDTSAHGWTVTEINHSRSDSGDAFRIRKKKNNKHYRKRRSQSYDSSSSQSDLEGDKRRENQEEVKDDGVKEDKDVLKTYVGHKDDHVSSSDDIRRSKSGLDFKKPKHKVSVKGDRSHSLSQSPDRHPHSTTEDPERCKEPDKKHERHHSEGDSWDKDGRKRWRDKRHFVTSYGSTRDHRHHGSERTSWKSRHNSYGSRSPSSDSNRNRHYEYHKRDRRSSRSPTRSGNVHSKRGFDSKYPQPHRSHKHRHQSRDSSSGKEEEVYKRAHRNPDHIDRRALSDKKSRYRKHEDRNSPVDPRRRRDERVCESRTEHRHHKSSSHDREAEEGERRKRKRTRTPSPTKQQGEKRHKSDLPVDSSSHGKQKDGSKVKSPVPEVEWDASLKKKGGGCDGRGDHTYSKWDGSQRSETVEELASQSHDKLGDLVKSWDGGKNTVDSSVVEGIGHKRSRDAWDEEMDRGKVKKRKDEGGKERRERSTADFHKNPFQDFQNWKNKSPHRRNHYHGKMNHSSFHHRR